MSSEGQLAIGLSIIAIIAMVVISVVQIIFKIYNIKKIRDEMLDESEILCRDLKRILTDYDQDDEEERYEIDLSLISYFKDNSLKLESLARRLTEHQAWYYRNPHLKQIGELLYWVINEFYDSTSDEEERIRIWSQNIPYFNSKYSDSFHKESIVPFTTQ